MSYIFAGGPAIVGVVFIFLIAVVERDVVAAARWWGLGSARISHHGRKWLLLVRVNAVGVHRPQNVHNCKSVYIRKIIDRIAVAKVASR